MNTHLRARHAPHFGPRGRAVLGGAALSLLALLAAGCIAGSAELPEPEEVGTDSQTLTWPNALDFGGAYGYVNGGTLSPNPNTQTSSCPAGYAATQVLGTYNVDYPAYFCQRAHQAGVDPLYDFGGMFGYVNAAPQPNPFTGAQSCPSGYTAQQLLGTYNVDHALYVCWRNHVLTTDPEYSFGGMYGYVNGAPVNNPATNAASCPAGYISRVGLGTSGVDYTLTYCYLPSVPLDFGGAWGYVNGAPVNNPATSGLSCPPGYADDQALGTNNVDYPAHFCWRPAQAGRTPVYDFGGMYGYVNGAPVNNPIVPGQQACPAGYSTQQILGTSGVDYPLVVCYRPHQNTTATGFGGVTGYVGAAVANNPATGTNGCPQGYTLTTVLGTTNVDHSLSFCWK